MTDNTVVDAAVLREIRWLQEHNPACEHGTTFAWLDARLLTAPMGFDSSPVELRRSLGRLRRRGDVLAVRRGFHPAKYIVAAVKAET